MENLARWIDCKNYTALEGEDEVHCGTCDNFRSNCGKDTCEECKGIDAEFYCSIDKLEI